MSLNAENFTEKTTETISKATEIARERGNIEVAPLHIASAIFADAEGYGPRLCQKLGCQVDKVTEALNKHIGRLPSQSPAPDQPHFSNSAVGVLRKAQEYQKKNNDTYLAVDSLLLALFDNDQVADAFKQAGIQKSAMQRAITESRGNKPVTSKLAETTFDALTKYGIDLVAQAAAGKLDPVIGRDEEIRRVIRVLCRRRKNNPVLIGEPGTVCVCV